MNRNTSRLVKLIVLIVIFILLLLSSGKGYSGFESHLSENKGTTFSSSNVIEPKEIRKSQNQFKTKLSPSWKYIHGKVGERDAMIEAKDFCILDGKLVCPSNLIEAPPLINLGGSADIMDVWFPIRYHSVDFKDVTYLQRPLFVIGGVWSTHMSHFFVNNMLPLLNVMNHYYKSTNWMSKERDLHVANEIELFNIKPFNFSNSWTVGNRPPKTICYETAIIGLNSTCDCCGCKKDLPDKVVYGQLKDIILKAHLTEAEYLNSKASPRKFHLVIVDRLSSRRILNLDEIESYLKKRKTSYQIVNLENLSFEQQVKLFALNTTMLLASHGNAVGSALWMKERSVLVEAHSYKQRSGTIALMIAWYEHIFGDAMKEKDEIVKNVREGNFVSSISPSGMSLDYYSLLCNDLECSGSDSRSDFNANFKISIPKIEMLLDRYDV
jgi:hypothetical protein